MNILIINAHEPFGDFAKGELNQTFVDLATETLQAKGHTIKVTKTASTIEHDAQEELEKHIWADAIILQSPMYWMGLPWSFKRYMDNIYTQGMAGQLCNMDGRSSADPMANYGKGGTRTDTKYMLSITMNAPKQAFDDDNEYLFQGKSVDDLFMPQHSNFRFFGMQALPTFSSHDVLKNADVENDMTRFKAHIEANF